MRRIGGALAALRLGAMVGGARAQGTAGVCTATRFDTIGGALGFLGMPGGTVTGTIDGGGNVFLPGFDTTFGTDSGGPPTRGRCRST